jgi:hypothetical protein
LGCNGQLKTLIIGGGIKEGGVFTADSLREKRPWMTSRRLYGLFVYIVTKGRDETTAFFIVPSKGL